MSLLTLVRLEVGVKLARGCVGIWGPPSYCPYKAQSTAFVGDSPDRLQLAHIQAAWLRNSTS